MRLICSIQRTSRGVCSQWGLVPLACELKGLCYKSSRLQQSAAHISLAVLAFMTLDDAQKNKVSQWIAEGLKLSDIQNRLSAELGIRMTYMDVRLLVDDLKLTPKDVEPSKAAALPGPGPAAAAAPAAQEKTRKAGAAPKPGAVSLSVDQLARPGAVVSGKVTFSDGNMAEWYFDQTGRLGLVPQQTGYRPPAADLQQFQTLLDSELSRLGF